MKVTDRHIRLFVLPAFLAVFAIIVLRNAWTCDDAYISFRTIDNFINGYGLTWNISERVQAYSHPLWLFVLTPIYALFGNMYFTAIVVSILFSYAAVGLYAFRLAEDALIAGIGVAAFALSGAFVDYSTSGLENPLTHFLLAIFLCLYFRREFDVRTMFHLSLTASLAAVNRLDIMVMYLPMLAYAFWQVRSRRAVAAVLAGFIPLFAWELFSLVYYGFLLPNPAYAKLSSGLSASRLFYRGIDYIRASVIIDPLTVVVIAAGIVVPFALRNRRAIPVALAPLFQMLYMLKIGGCFMAGRFLAAPFFVAVAVLTYLFCRSKLPRWLLLIPLALILLLGMTSDRAPIYSSPDDGPDDFVLENQICDEHVFYNPSTGLLNYDSDAAIWPAHEWAQKGNELRKAGDTLVVDWTIGMVGFFAGPKVHIVDVLGLTDPFLARLAVLPGVDYKTGHYHRRLPAGYLQSLRSGENVITDTLLAEYFDRINLVTRGKLFDPGRLSEIVRFMLGLNDHLVEHYAKPYMRTVPHKFIDYRPPQRTGWFHYDNFVFGLDGLRIPFEETRYDEMYEIGRDHDDVLRATYYLDGNKIAEHLIPAQITPGGGIASSLVRVPTSAVVSGYDEIRIVPEQGDGFFSLSHLRFIQDDTER